MKSQERQQFWQQYVDAWQVSSLSCTIFVNCSGIVSLTTYLYLCRLERIHSFLYISNQMPRATKRLLDTRITLPSFK